MNDEKNSTQIVDAQKAQLQKRINIAQMQNKITDIHYKVCQTDYKVLVDLYLTIFKNIGSEKKFACDIDTFNSKYTYSYDQDKTQKRRLFINKDGFSMSFNFEPIGLSPQKEKDINTSRSDYIHTNRNFSDFILTLKRLYKQKDEIINAIEKDQKKEIAIKFFQAFELSGCDKAFDYYNEFDTLKVDIIPNKMIEFFDGNNIKSYKMEYIQCKDASSSVTVGKNTEATWRNNDLSVSFNDLEKVSQIYEELIQFLDTYYQQFVIQDISLNNLISSLKEAFAKELILKSLDDKK